MTARLPLVLGSDGLPQQVQVADSITVATQASSDNATNVASTAFVQNVVGAVSVAVTGGAVSLTAAQAAAGTLLLTGVLTSNVVISFAAGATSAYTRAYTVANGTTGAFTVTLQACATTPANSLPVSQGMSAEVYTTGASIFTAGSDLQQLAVFTSTLRGLAPLSGGGTANYLRADGTWATPGGAGVGTVTSVGVTTAAGVSGSVANPTSTPAITITLGAITPSSVAATGAVTGSNLSGTNTGDQSLAAYATLASPTFTGSATMSGLALDATISSTTGVITKGGVRFIHDFTPGASGQNIFIGKYSGNFTMTGSSGTGSNNIGIGPNTLTASTTGYQNIAIGMGAMSISAITGNGNVAIGSSALNSMTSGAYNLGVGDSSFGSTSTGSNNVGVGVFSGQKNTTGSNNVAIGYSALQLSTAGSQSVAIGQSALAGCTTGVNSFGAITGGTGYTNGTYTGVSLAYSSGTTVNVSYPQVNITVSGGVVTAVTLLTAGAGFKDTTTVMTATAASIGGTGSGFTIVVASLTTGSGNVAIGANSLSAITFGTGNIAIGNSAGSGQTITNCIMLGASATTNLSSGDGNIGIGTYSGYQMTTILGGLGTIIPGSGYTNGTYSGVNFSRVAGSTASNYGTANVTVAGGVVTAVTIVSGGSQYLDATTTLTVTAAQIGGTGSGFSVSVGYVTAPVSNTAVGVSTLSGSGPSGYCSAFGQFALNLNTTGVYNTALGTRAGNGGGGAEGSTVDTYCTFVGSNASRNSSVPTTTVLTNMTVIGNAAKGTASNQVTIGNTSVTATVLQGIVSTTTAFKLPSYTVGTVPAASTGAGCLVYISNPTTGNPRAYTSNGTNWYDGAGTLLA